MDSGRTTHRTLRATIALALVYLMVWGGIPIPALAEMAEGGAPPSGQPAQGGRSEGDDGGATSEPAAPDGAEAPDGVAAPASPAADSDGPGSDRPTDEPEVTELTAVPERRTSSAEGDGRSGEELLAEYVQMRLEEPLGRSDQGGLLSTQSAESSLEGIDLVAFGKLKTLVGEVASGSRASARLTIPVSQLTSDLGPWTASELGVASVVEDGQIAQAAAEAAAERVSFDLGRVVHALLADCPYELYWYDKTAGTGYAPCEVSATWSGGEWRIGCAGDAVVEMRVSADFSATGDAGTTDVDPSVASAGSAVSTAVERAGQVVGDNAGKAALERLAAYRDAICSEAAYNGEAPKGAAYGNPWQLVWVFDGDPGTDVVCEGYAKAFKYLCDLTWPGEDPDVECLLATGTMAGGTGAGPHMWNVVRMDDGRSYLVDVTNCDEGTVGAPDKLFMAHGPSGSFADGYTFGIGEADVSYAYDDDTKAAFGEAALSLSDRAYAGPVGATQVEAPVAAEGLVYDGSEQVGVEAGEGYALSGDFKATGAGEYAATATLEDGYEWADGTTGPKDIAWSIARKAVTVTADDKSKRAGEADPELTATVAGTIGHDTVSYALARAEGDEPGEYAITPTGDAGQGNYAVTFVAGKLVISQSEDVVASGTWGTCPWEIDSAGKLTVRPGVGESQQYRAFSPWSAYESRVTSVTFAQTGGERVVLPAESGCLFFGLSKVKSMDLSGCDVSGVTGMSYMFIDCERLASLDLSSWDTSSVTETKSMFHNCSSLTSIDFSGWDTSEVTNMDGMFFGCSKLVEIKGISGWDTSGVTDMHSMFSGCSSLSSLSVSGWDTSNVTDMGWMFSGCSSLASLDLSGWDTSNVTTGNGMTGMFEFCSSLASVGDLSDWDTSNVRGMSSMFEDCSSLSSVGDLSGWKTSEVTGMEGMFQGCSSLSSLDLSGWDTSSLVQTERMFSGCSSLEALDLSGWDTSSVTEAWKARDMFSGCSSLAELGVGPSYQIKNAYMFPDATADNGKWWSTANQAWYSKDEIVASRSGVADTYLSSSTDPSGRQGTWGECSWSIDSNGLLRVWPTNGASGRLADSDEQSPRFPWLEYAADIVSVTFEDGVSLPEDASDMFSGCSSLTSLDPSGWDTSSVRYTNRMFSGCSSLSSLDLSDWDTSSLEQTVRMFSGCSSIETLDLSGWDASSTWDMAGMFEYCISLTSLDVSGWSVSSAQFLNSMFARCSSLASLDLSGWDTSSVTDAQCMFLGCSSLAEFKVGPAYQIKSADMFPDATADNGKWWSTADRAWYTKDEVVSTRSGVADTYTSVQGGGTAKPLSSCTVTLSQSSYVYDGTQKTPTLTVKDGSTTLVEGTAYTVTWPSGRTNAGTYTVTVTGKGDYTGTVTRDFTISAKSLSSCTVTLSQPTYTYDGTQKSPTVTVKDGSTTLTAGTHYTLTTPSGRTNAGTYTYKVTGKGNYTGTKTATLTISAPESPGLDALTFSFSNSRSAFGYSNPYHIPLESFRIVFGEATAQYWYMYAGSWGGNCHGMSAVSRMLNTPGSGLTVRGFRSSASKVSDLSPSNTNSGTGKTLTRYIEAMQVSQYDSTIQSARRSTRNDLDALCAAVLESKRTGQLVDIGIYGRIGSSMAGHSIVGYDVQTVSSTQKRLYVYDCNFPKQVRYITISTNSSGKCTGWYYKLNDVYNWGSSYADSYINYTPYSAIQSVWDGGGGTHVVNSLATNSQSFEVKDGEGNLVARVSDGELTQSSEGVWQFVATSVTADGIEEGSGENVLLYMPSDAAYSFTSTDSSVDQLEIGMANAEQSAMVTTDASEVTFAVNDDEDVNMVSVEADAGETYSVILNSDLPSASGQEVIELSGIGNGESLSVGTLSGNCVIVNGGTATLVVNGEPVDIGSRIGITAVEASLEYTSCDYDGTAHEPKVTIVHDNDTLVEERDYVVKYSNNVEAGTATATAYGIGGYDGKAQLTFTIRPEQAIAAADKTVAVGKTVSLGATVSGDGVLSYESSDTAVATVNASGVVTGIKPGTATITITASSTDNYASGTKSVTVTVTKGAQAITASNKSVAMGKTVSLGAKASGGGKLTYKSSNTKVATVSSTGVVTPKGVGKATITITAAATANYAAATKKVTVTVTKGTQAISASGKTVMTGKTVSLGAKLTAGNGKLTYKSSNTGVATVSAKGVVTGKDVGTVKITITAAGTANWNKATRTVSVKVTAQAGTWKGSGSKWWYQWANGNYPKSQFLTISGKTYYFDASGYCVYGWKQIGGKYYYFESSGAMAKNKWVGNYWLGADGVMATNAWVDGGKYWVGSDGAWVKGKTR